MIERRVLVTGSSGFTGHYVCSELESRGFKVFGASEDLSIKGSSINLEDSAGLSKLIKEVQPTHVIHLAAIAFVGHGRTEDFHRVNVEGTENLLHAISAFASNVQNVILASSANIYGNGHEGIAIHEETVPSPANEYAQSKLDMEFMSQGWISRLPISIVRPFNYTGIGQSEKFLIPKIVKAYAEEKEFLELGNLNVARDFSDVRFIAQAYGEIAERCINGITINLCSGVSTSLMSIIHLCEEISNHHLEVVSKEEFKRASEVSSLKGSTERMEKVLGFKSPFTLNETLRWMYHSMKF